MGVQVMVVMIFISKKKGDLPGSWKDVATMLNGLEGTRYVTKGQRSVLMDVVCDVETCLSNCSGVAWKRAKEGKVRGCVIVGVVTL